MERVDVAAVDGAFGDGAAERIDQDRADDQISSSGRLGLSRSSKL